MTNHYTAVLTSQETVQCHAGRSLLHWAVLKGSDEVFSAILTRLQSATVETEGTLHGEHTTRMRQLLLRADHYSDNPITSAIRAHAAMKVC